MTRSLTIHKQSYFKECYKFWLRFRAFVSLNPPGANEFDLSRNTKRCKAWRAHLRVVYQNFSCLRPMLSSVRGFEIISLLFSQVCGLPDDLAQSDRVKNNTKWGIKSGLKLPRKEEHIGVINILIKGFEQVQLRVDSVEGCQAFVTCRAKTNRRSWKSIIFQTQATQAHYMNADVTVACERCCVT